MQLLSKFVQFTTPCHCLIAGDFEKPAAACNTSVWIIARRDVTDEEWKPAATRHKGKLNNTILSSYNWIKKF